MHRAAHTRRCGALLRVAVCRFHVGAVQMQQLEVLLVRDCVRLDDCGVCCVASSCPALVQLNLDDCPSITDAGTLPVLLVSRAFACIVSQIHIPGYGSATVYEPPLSVKPETLSRAS